MESTIKLIEQLETRKDLTEADSELLGTIAHSCRHAAIMAKTWNKCYN